MKDWIKDYYQEGLYSQDDLKTFVDAGWLTQSDYDDIVKE